MSKTNNQKIKLLLLYDLLCKNTDEEHALSTDEIITKLNEQGIVVANKVLLDDIALLNEFGFEVQQYKKRSYYFYVSYRAFDTAELKVLIDAVQSASFITESKTVDFVNRLAAMAGVNKAESLKKSLVCFDTIKHSNKAVFYNIDTIEEAIEAEKQLSFQYFNLGIHREKVYRKNGDRYKVCPLALVFSHENYYLVCYDEKHSDTVNYRVDRIDTPMIEKEGFILPKKYESFNINTYRQQAFAMYHGELEEVTLTVKNGMLGDIYDRFGENVKIIIDGEEQFRVRVKIQVSPIFYTWIVGSCGKVKILAPQGIVKSFNSFVQQIKDNY